MRRIALINQKGGVGKTTTTVNLGAALAEAGKRVLLIDLDPQANLTLHLDCAPEPESRSIYDVLTGNCTLDEATRATGVENLWVVPSDIDLSGAELELAASFGRESLLKDAVEHRDRGAEGTKGSLEFDYLLFDCPPSLGLLSINGMVAAGEVILTLQTEFFALQGMSKLVDVIALLRRRLNPELTIAGILPCLYDTRLKLAREVLAEIRKYFPGQVFERPIAKNVKLAEAPSYGQTILQYAPDSSGAQDYRQLAASVLAQEAAAPPSPEPESPREPVELTPAPRPPASAPRPRAPRVHASTPPPSELPE